MSGRFFVLSAPPAQSRAVYDVSAQVDDLSSRLDDLETGTGDQAAASVDDNATAISDICGAISSNDLGDFTTLGTFISDLNSACP